MMCVCSFCRRDTTDTRGRNIWQGHMLFRQVSTGMKGRGGREEEGL